MARGRRGRSENAIYRVSAKRRDVALSGRWISEGNNDLPEWTYI